MQKVLINADGGSRGNPGPAAIGVIIWDDDRTQLEGFGEKIGRATNNEAEYRALIKALELASKYTREEALVFMDSELVIKQMKGLYRVKQEHLHKLYLKAKENENFFKKVTYNYTSRNNLFQSKADELVNLAFDGR